ncbi:MAG: PA2778 family cysteine peptidase [Steroidobacteraceae bacterium]
MMRIGRTAVLAVALLASGCGTLPGRSGGPGATAPWPADTPPQVDLSATPFFPQDDHQCGPAALATLLGASGAHVTPAELVGDVYIPARKGSLQIEMLAAARQRHRIPYVIEPRFETLVRLLAEGRPVLVLLNLGVDAWPIWHYAVAVGYERDAGRMLLRSGRTQRARMSLWRFKGAWGRAHRWGFVVLRPGEVPQAATASGFAAAVADFEHIDKGAALRAYVAGITRWPDAPLLRLGAANMRLAEGDRAGAEEDLRELLLRAPNDVAARNNYAELLSLRGCREAALAEIAVAREHARGTALAVAVDATAGEINARAPAAGEPCP